MSSNQIMVQNKKLLLKLINFNRKNPSLRNIVSESLYLLNRTANWNKSYEIPIFDKDNIIMLNKKLMDNVDKNRSFDEINKLYLSILNNGNAFDNKIDNVLLSITPKLIYINFYEKELQDYIADIMYIIFVLGFCGARASLLSMFEGFLLQLDKSFSDSDTNMDFIKDFHGDISDIIYEFFMVNPPSYSEEFGYLFKSVYMKRGSNKVAIEEVLEIL